MSGQRILGVDPGLRTTGYGVIEADGRGLRLIEAGILRPEPSLALEQRLLQLHAAMIDVVRTTQPACMVIEELWSAYEHPQTAVLMGHARGVLALAAGANGIVVHHLAHTVVKLAVAGSGSARKSQVKGMVVRLLGLREAPQPDDVSDALALAIAFAFRSSAGVPPAIGAARARRRAALPGGL